MYTAGRLGRKDAALKGTGADALGVKNVFPHLHMLLPVKEEVDDQPADGVEERAPGRDCPAAKLE